MADADVTALHRRWRESRALEDAIRYLSAARRAHPAAPFPPQALFPEQAPRPLQGLATGPPRERALALEPLPSLRGRVIARGYWQYQEAQLLVLGHEGHELLCVPPGEGSGRALVGYSWPPVGASVEEAERAAGLLRDEWWGWGSDHALAALGLEEMSGVLAVDLAPLLLCDLLALAAHPERVGPAVAWLDLLFGWHRWAEGNDWEPGRTLWTGDELPAARRPRGGQLPELHARVAPERVDLRLLVERPLTRHGWIGAGFRVSLVEVLATPAGWSVERKVLREEFLGQPKT